MSNTSDAKSGAKVVSVPQWLILGSFAAPEGYTNQFLAMGLEGEEALTARLGWAGGGTAAVWQGWEGEEVDFLHPALGFTTTTCCYAYAMCYIFSPRDTEATLLAGSDDGIAVWLDGVPVHFNDVHRGLSAGDDLVPVHLHAGWNKLLVKISQGNGSWGFIVQFRVPADVAEGLSFSQHPPDLGGDGQDVVHLRDRRNGLALQPTADGMAFSLSLQLLSESGKRGDGAVLELLGLNDAVLATKTVANFPAFGTAQVTLECDAQGVLNTLAAGQPVRVTYRGDNGQSEWRSESRHLLPILLEVISGFRIESLRGPLPVPPIFRGQPGLLEVLSEREIRIHPLSRPATPLRVAQEFTAAQTKTGRVKPTIKLPAELYDPVARLWFGPARFRRLVQRLDMYASRFTTDLGAAEASMYNALAALAAGKFAPLAAAMEQIFADLSKAAGNNKHESITLVGHAHIDMNWLWDTAETVKATHDTFRQAMAFMDEFPQFCFSQSQSSTYEFIERTDPVLFKRVQQRVKEGRWEPLGGMVDEGDTNLSGGEAIARSLLLGQRYFLSKLGRAATVGWLPDNFGHVAQLPQLLNLSGMKSYYGHRCMPKQGPFVWEGVDGSRVLCFITETYNGTVMPATMLMPKKLNPQSGKAMLVYGVGDHGGGPTRADIVNAIDFNELPGTPTLKFGTAEAFHEELRADEKTFDVFKGERQYIFEGCYTSIARVKEGSRRGENALYAAELLCALAALRGHKYPAAALEDAWHAICFNQFHDILCGSAVHESNRESVALYDRALEQAGEALYSAMRHLAAAVPTDDHRGQPVVVFNPHPCKRSDIVEAEVFTYNTMPTLTAETWGQGGPVEANMGKIRTKCIEGAQGPYLTMHMTDAAGKAVDAQVVASKIFPGGQRLKVRFLADMPAGGAKTFYVNSLAMPPKPAKTIRIDGTTIDTDSLTVRLDPATGHVTSIFDKTIGRELIEKGQPANVLKYYMEKPHGMTAWDIGPIDFVQTLDGVDNIRVTENGPVRATVEIWRTHSRSRFVQRVHVYRDLPRVEFGLDAYWFEQGSPKTGVPMLRVSFPLNVTDGRFLCDTPFAAVERPTTGREVPAQKWVDLADATGGAALLSDTKFGFRCDRNNVEMTLLRASYDPDPFPDQGPHFIRYALQGHAGDVPTADLVQAGLCFNVPMPAIETPAGQKGTLDSGTSLLALASPSVKLAAVKKAQDDASLIVRLWESAGKNATATLTLPKPARKVQRVDLLEFPIKNAPAATLTGNTVKVKVKPHEIVTLKITMK
ncbi:MAG: glycosyl hydrolase-related protein [Phycisphaerae bacterium]|nr:glycosyl hydrolase-related protein [Phycisphaerae bacterium]